MGLHLVGTSSGKEEKSQTLRKNRFLHTFKELNDAELCI